MFQEYQINYSWQQKNSTMTPLFAATQLPSSLVSFGSLSMDATDGGQLRATQNPQFSLTQTTTGATVASQTHDWLNPTSLVSNPKRLNPILSLIQLNHCWIIFSEFRTFLNQHLHRFPWEHNPPVCCLVRLVTDESSSLFERFYPWPRLQDRPATLRTQVRAVNTALPFAVCTLNSPWWWWFS